jgi:DNA (cytosine-5)-methyltransferase 1
MACDIDESIRSIYEENFKIRPKGDIRGLCMSEIPDFDILCAGFPCQPFSIAGKKESFNNKTDGNLFYDILKIIDNKRPSVLFLENVKNLYSI